MEVIAKLCAIAGRSVAEVMAADPYWISNPTERALIDAWRAMPDDQRQAFAILAETRKLQKLQRSARRAAYRSSDNATFRIDWQRYDA